MAPSSQPTTGFPVGPVAVALPTRGVLALRLVELAMLMLRAAAILVLLSPLLVAAILAA